MASQTGANSLNSGRPILLGLAVVMVVGLVFASGASASADDARLYRYGYPGCDYSAATNHFELAPGESVQFLLDLTQCTPDFMGGMLYFGYKTTRNSSRPLELKDGISLKLMDALNGLEVNYEDLDGYNGAGKLEHVFINMAENPGYVILFAENTNARKTLTIRLRSECGL